MWESPKIAADHGGAGELRKLYGEDASAADLTSCVAAELGALARKIAYERWSDAADGDDVSEVARSVALLASSVLR